MTREVIAGIDIGGTKIAVGLADRDGQLLALSRFPPRVEPGPRRILDKAVNEIGKLLNESGARVVAAGVGCGGPLDSKRGLILSPPNLPNWDHIDVITPFRDRFGVPVALQNDANASALAEWKWGAGRGTRNMIFLTFGTGMGAGLILDGRLYAGTNDMAGEVGHIRLAAEGPVGYGKAGSFEGFCSGGGIAQLARQIADQRITAG